MAGCLAGNDMPVLLLCQLLHLLCLHAPMHAAVPNTRCACCA